MREDFGWLVLTDANYGNDLYVRAAQVDAMTVVAENTYREGNIPDGVFRRTMVYTRGGNCLTVRETPETIQGMLRAANPDLGPVQRAPTPQSAGKSDV